MPGNAEVVYQSPGLTAALTNIGDVARACLGSVVLPRINMEIDLDIGLPFTLDLSLKLKALKLRFELEMAECQSENDCINTIMENLTVYVNSQAMQGHPADASVTALMTNLTTRQVELNTRTLDYQTKIAALPAQIQAVDDIGNDMEIRKAGNNVVLGVINEIDNPGGGGGDPPPTPDVACPAASLNSDSNTATLVGVSGRMQPDPQIITISNTGNGVLLWSAVASAAWITVSPLSGYLQEGQQEQITLSGDITQTTKGTHVGTVTITAPNAENSPLILNIEMTVA